MYIFSMSCTYFLYLFDFSPWFIYFHKLILSACTEYFICTCIFFKLLIHFIYIHGIYTQFIYCHMWYLPINVFNMIITHYSFLFTSCRESEFIFSDVIFLHFTIIFPMLFQCISGWKGPLHVIHIITCEMHVIFP